MTGFNMNGATSTDYMKMLFAQQGGSYYNEDGAANLASEEMINAADNYERPAAGLGCKSPVQYKTELGF